MTEETEAPTLNWRAVLQTATDFATIDKQLKVLSKRKTELRDALYSLVELEGVEDDKGHLRLDLPEECNGITALVIQRKVSTGFDAEAAEHVLKDIHLPDGSTLWDECIEMVAVLDEDKVMAARYDDLLTDEQVDLLYPQTESFAFTPVRLKGA